MSTHACCPPSERAVQVVVPSADAREVAGLVAQQIGQRGQLRRQRRREPHHADRHRRAAGHQRRPRRDALRAADEHPVESHPLGRKAVEVRRLHVLVSVAAEIRVAVIVGEQEQDVRFLRGKTSSAKNAPADAEEHTQGFHSLRSPVLATVVISPRQSTRTFSGVDPRREPGQIGLHRGILRVFRQIRPFVGVLVVIV